MKAKQRRNNLGREAWESTVKKELGVAHVPGMKVQEKRQTRRSASNTNATGAYLESKARYFADEKEERKLKREARLERFELTNASDVIHISNFLAEYREAEDPEDKDEEEDFVASEHSSESESIDEDDEDILDDDDNDDDIDDRDDGEYRRKSKKKKRNKKKKSKSDHSKIDAISTGDQPRHQTTTTASRYGSSMQEERPQKRQRGTPNRPSSSQSRSKTASPISSNPLLGGGTVMKRSYKEWERLNFTDVIFDEFGNPQSSTFKEQRKNAAGIIADYISVAAGPPKVPASINLCEVTGLAGKYKDKTTGLWCSGVQSLKMIEEQPPQWIKAAPIAPYYEAIQLIHEERRRRRRKENAQAALLVAATVTPPIAHISQ